jgi:hypothetical protein
MDNDPPHLPSLPRAAKNFARAATNLPAFCDQQLLKTAAEPAILLQENGSGEIAAMKAFTVAAVILALMAVPVHAQQRRQPNEEKKTEAPEKKIDDKAYKAALERIPEPKEKYDPWGVARPAEPAKKPKAP